MPEEILWDRFAESGSIADYLQYAAQKGSNGFADSQGCCTGAENSR